MEELNKLRRFYHLKNVERNITVKNRKKSPAEHSWSCLILADYFLNQMEKPMDRLKIYELLIYHDVVEIESGDICISKVEGRKNKQEKEKKATEKLKKQLPLLLKEKFLKLFKEFEEQKTIEAKFAKCIDKLDAIIHLMDYKEDWKGWTEKFIREHKEHLFEDFPEAKKVFKDSLTYCRDKGFFNQMT